MMHTLPKAKVYSLCRWRKWLTGYWQLRRSQTLKPKLLRMMKQLLHDPLLICIENLHITSCQHAWNDLISEHELYTYVAERADHVIPARNMRALRRGAEVDCSCNQGARAWISLQKAQLHEVLLFLYSPRASPMASVSFNILLRLWTSYQNGL